LIMVSTKLRSPIFWPLRRWAACGDWLMLSWPPATTISQEPSWICWAASAMARSPEPQSWLEAPGGRLHRQAGVDRRWRAGPAGAGLQHLAHDHFVDIGGRDAGALQRRQDGHLAEFVGGQAGQRPLNEPTAVRARKR